MGSGRRLVKKQVLVSGGRLVRRQVQISELALCLDVEWRSSS